MPEAPGLLAQLFPILLIFVIFYFLLIRPQQKRAKEHQKMLDALKKDDEVVTAGGVYGRITALTDAVATVEIAPNVRIKVQRGQIAVVKAPETGSKEKEKDKA